MSIVYKLFMEPKTIDDHINHMKLGKSREVNLHVATFDILVSVLTYDMSLPKMQNLSDCKEGYEIKIQYIFHYELLALGQMSIDKIIDKDRETPDWYLSQQFSDRYKNKIKFRKKAFESSMEIGTKLQEALQDVNININGIPFNEAKKEEIKIKNIVHVRYTF